MNLAELREAMSGVDQLTLIDLRPESEFASGHVPGAVNVPPVHLAERLAELPRDTPVGVYCRGPYCVMPAAAVHHRREAGFSRRPARHRLPRLAHRVRHPAA